MQIDSNGKGVPRWEEGGDFLLVGGGGIKSLGILREDSCYSFIIPPPLPPPSCLLIALASLHPLPMNECAPTK